MISDRFLLNKMTKLFPGRTERVYTAWILFVSISLLLALLMLSEIEEALLGIFTSYHWAFVFLIPAIARVILVLKYQKASAEQIGESERNTSEHRGMFLTLAGFSFSALFALVLAATSSSANTQLIGTSILLMLLSFLMFYGAFTVEGFKYYRWQVDLVDVMSDIGRLALLLSVLAAIYGAPIESYIKVTCLLFFLFFWLISFFLHFKARHSYLSAFQ